jgi:hypothetical protein
MKHEKFKVLDFEQLIEEQFTSLEDNVVYKDEKRLTKLEEQIFKYKYLKIVI